MFEVLQKEIGITIALFSCMALSILLRVLLGLLYRNMIRETDNMATTNNKLLKQCKIKFANCFELSGGVSNIPVFVDRFLNHLSLGPLSFGMLYHLSGQLMLLSVVVSGVGICKSIIVGRTLGEILPFYIISLLGLYLYFSVSTMVDVKSKRRTLKTNLVDYLENHLSPRIDITRQDMDMLYGEAAFRETEKAPGLGGTTRRGTKGAGGRRARQTVELMPISGRPAVAPGRMSEEAPAEAGEPQKQNPAAVTEEELEALLREFLTT